MEADRLLAEFAASERGVDSEGKAFVSYVEAVDDLERIARVPLLFFPLLSPSDFLSLYLSSMNYLPLFQLSLSSVVSF